MLIHPKGSTSGQSLASRRELASSELTLVGRPSASLTDPPPSLTDVRSRFEAFGFSPSILPPAHESWVPFLSVPGQVLRERLHRLEDVGQTFAVEFRSVHISIPSSRPLHQV